MPKKKTSKNNNNNNISTRDDNNESTKITKEDATCPICQDIFDVEIHEKNEITQVPILLPCNHRICESCLMGIVDHANIECPFCRRRLNTWVRTNKMSKNGCQQFIDKKFMTSIERLKEELGEDLLNSSQDDFTPVKNISMPGEVGEDFRREQEKLDKSRQEAERKEEEASRLFIEKLLREEKEQQNEELKKRESDSKNQEEQDRLFAEELSKSLNKTENIIGGLDAGGCPSLGTRSRRKNKNLEDKKTEGSNDSALGDSVSMVPDKENVPPTNEDNNNSSSPNISESFKRKEMNRLSGRFKKKVKIGE